MKPGSANLEQKKLLIAIAFLIPLAFFLRLNSYQLLFEEPRRALVAIEMILSDNWLVPTTNGELYYNKPPLYNWVLVFFMNALGSAEWVVRLPSVLSLFATALIHYHISRKYIGGKAALLSSLFYITSADILFFFSLLGEIDLFYAFIVYLQCVLIFHFYQQKKWHWLYLSTYLLTSAGVLTKGIPSLFFQGITLILILFLNKDLKRIFSIWHLAGLLLLALTSGAYFYLYSQQYEVGHYLARLFTETFSRTALEKNVTDNFSHIINFPVMLLKVSAPWILLFGLTYKSNRKAKLKSNPFINFCLWFCIANGMIYFLSPGTRERYLYMFLPFIFAILAHAFGELQDNPWIKRFYLFVGTIVIVGLIGVGAFGITLNSISPSILCFLLAIIIAGGICFLKLSNVYSYLLATVIFTLVARVGFNLVVLPTKKQNEPYKADAKKMAQLVGSEPLYLTGPPQPKTDDVKFAGKHFITFKRDEPAYLAFQTSFYLSRLSGKILKYNATHEKPGFYISEEKFIDPAKVKVFYRFNNKLNHKDNWYILYKTRPL
jgi:4-amino-4-deoxy-L-arabinose transferase-like glycosyltransferase